MSTDSIRSLGRGVLADLDREHRQALSVEAQRAIAELRSRAERETRQLLINTTAILDVPLAAGESVTHRTNLGVAEYLRWHASMERIRRTARAHRRDGRGSPVGSGDRTGLKKDFVVIATVAGTVALATAASPVVALLGAMWLLAAMLLLAEIGYGTTSLIGGCWLALGIVGYWQRSALGEWALSFRWWFLPAGLLLVGLTGLFAARRRHRAPSGVHERNPHEW
ncbi:hypothetical protein KBZ10_10630 [Streptomyces sp. F63]|uniref:hypothetical protein n=1 Tax=Streptomyces sp. F63 TaxID=2824887 RepID=UPI001B382F26|nr:hypothetical protein [Streptomyces sp. F63]MBQ0984965.1 hypothetical protein [Streptomyces sp. F63]